MGMGSSSENKKKDKDQAKKLDYGRPARRIANNETPMELGEGSEAADSNGTQKDPEQS